MAASNQGAVATNPTIETLAAVLSECDGTVTKLFNVLNDDKGISAEPRSIAKLARRLNHQLEAALNLSCTIEDDSEGWPDDCAELTEVTGPRSGYPTDLVNGCLDKAIGCTGVTCAALGHDGKSNDGLLLKSPEPLSSMVWGVQSYLQTVLNILNHGKA